MSPEEQRKYMYRAFELAFSSMGLTSPNPSVGAVIVRDGDIVGFGATSPCGGDHAEVAALAMAGEKSRGAEMFVSLEPCCHYGKTPPCTEAIIRGGIARIYIPLVDPNPMVAGKGILMLKNNGVDVVLLSELGDYAADMIRGFKKSILRKRSAVIHKSAISLDGKIATLSGDSRWISSSLSRYVVHRLRATVDAIIVGKNTVEKDNPSLNIRMNEFDDTITAFFNEERWWYSGRNNSYLENILRGTGIRREKDPLRVVVGLPQKLNLSMNIFRDDNYIVFADEKQSSRLKGRDDYSDIQNMRDTGNLFLYTGNTVREQVYCILEELYRRNVVNALLEGGGGVAGSFLDAGEIDQFMYFITPRILGNGISPLNATGNHSVSEALALRDISIIGLESDVLYTGYREQYLLESM
ncbi:MAG: bifunctional diaminohydroxyphosphoribosylaminopyrimidine deaminase/5-amino-6-(5-phosphoribosylamino)uracil reductase RibD [Spirochaetota bacterium]